jgi:hypothetical protein
LRNADVFIAFALGLTRGANGEETPGLSNLAIAEWLIANNPDRRPTLTQQGVYLALKHFEADQPALAVDTWTLQLPHHPRVYVDTQGAALQCWAIMHLKGFHRPALISHDLQLQRMVWIFERLRCAEELIVPDNVPTIPFDAASAQHWGTRSRRGWLLWETFLARPAMGRIAGLIWLGGAAVLGAILSALVLFFGF